MLLTLVSLDVLYSVFVSVAYGPEVLAKYAMHTAFLFRGMNYLALLLIGIGLLLMSGAAKSVVKPKK